MRTLFFAILLASLVLSYHAEARHTCPNICTSRKRARRQCRGRRENCKVVSCRRRRRACVPISEPRSSLTPTPSQSPSASPSSSISPTPSSSPSISPTPSVSPTPSTTPSITPSPSPTPILNILSDGRGVSCPSGSSPGPFGGDTCDLTSLRVILAVGPSVRFGFPSRASCPDNIVAGGGEAGCTFCGDDTSNTVRELFVNVFNNNAGCTEGLDLTRRIGESLEATATADGANLCPRDFDTDDGGPYITITLKSKFQNVLSDAFCV